MKLTDTLQHPALAPLLIQILLAYEWFTGGLGKITSGTFVSELPKTLARFSEGNPHTWYVSEILTAAKASAPLFGQLVQWGELLTGVGLLVGVMSCCPRNRPFLRSIGILSSIVSLIAGAVMNLNFYYAAGWLNASTKGFNFFLLWTQLILLVFWCIERSKKVRHV